MQRDPDSEYLSGLTVLLVEDEGEVREEMAQFLGRRVGRLLTAENGEQGLALFRQEQPDLVVTDIMMPVMDGLAMARRILERDPRVPVVVVTAFGQLDYLMQAIQSGISSYVMKPVQSELLEAALLKGARSLRLEAELALLRRQKLEQLQTSHEASIGILAGGLAHDYNNLLQSILMTFSMVKLYIDNPKEALECLKGADTAWEEARELSDRLALLSQSSESYRRSCGIEELLWSGLGWVIEGTDCKVSYELPKDLPEVLVDEPQVQKVFSILAQNAAEAMQGRGTLRVGGEVREVREDDRLPLIAGTYLRVSFADEGPGIAPEVLPLIFMPYSSTKARGKDRGMGLGLAMAQAILKLHRGGLVAESTPGSGATFHIYLPLPGASAQGAVPS